MSDLEYVTTINTSSSSEIKTFPFEQSEIIRFSIHEIGAYATLLSLISHVFTRAQLLYEEEFLENQYRVTVVLEGSVREKYKEADLETKLDRVIWWFENAAIPTCGIIIQIYINHKLKSFLDSPFSFNTLWHSRQINRGKNSNYVTFHPHVEIDWNNGKSSHRVNGYLDQLKLCKKICTDLGYDIVELDYTSKIQYAYDMLLGAKCHIGYIGSIHYLAAFCRTPCLTVGKHVPGIHPNMSPYGLTRTSEYNHLAPEYELDNGRMRVWNELGTSPGRTLMYNFNTKHMYQDEPRYYVMAEPSNLRQTEHECKKILL